MSAKQEVIRLAQILETEYQTPQQFAEKLGITTRRVRQLLQFDRIDDVVWVHGTQYIPLDPHIRRGDVVREGRISEYMDEWDRRHGVAPVFRDPWEREAEEFIVRGAISPPAYIDERNAFND